MGDLLAKELVEKRGGFEPEPEDTKSVFDLIHLGIDVSRQEQHLQERVKGISRWLIANPRAASLDLSGMPALGEWEVRAFRTEYGEEERSFRAEFAKAVRYAIGIVVRIHEELSAYEAAREGTDTGSKKYADSLLYLLYKGRKHLVILRLLAADTEKRMLPEKARQLLSTASKLG